jgi:hypothetical protein
MIFLAFGDAPLDLKSRILVYTDTMAPGWNYMDSCLAFEIQVDSSCKVSWRVIKKNEASGNKNGKLSISALSQDCRWICKKPFSDLTTEHQAIFDSIFSRWPISRFTGLTYGSFHKNNDYSWNYDIAIASTKSFKFVDYRKNYPNSKYSSNEIFVELANLVDAYKELRQIIEKHDCQMRLSAVEEVFGCQVDKLPFSKQMYSRGLKKTDQVLWDAGITYFSFLKPLTKK